MPTTSAAISTPAGFAPAYAIGYSDLSGRLALVSNAAPLPVATLAPAPIALSGAATASQIAGPFAATAGRVIVVTLDGVWDGTVRLLRSTDGGASWAEYTQPGCEQAWTETEEGTSFYLDIALNSGTIDYRVSQ
jgi:hypothetical protein